MANEFRVMPNPDNVPSAVTTGYQAQNELLYALIKGLDTTEPNDDASFSSGSWTGGNVKIPAGGIIEVNGKVFRNAEEINLSRGSGNAHNTVWVAVLPDGTGRATVSVSLSPGVRDAARQGFYLANGSRVLNWKSAVNP
jgi:hypothetical protein